MGQIEAHVFLFCRSINAFQFDLYSMSAILVEAVRVPFVSRFSKKAKEAEKQKNQIKLQYISKHICRARDSRSQRIWLCLCSVSACGGPNGKHAHTLTQGHKLYRMFLYRVSAFRFIFFYTLSVSRLFLLPTKLFGTPFSVCTLQTI